MPTRVTAILVAQRGSHWLDETLAALAAQTRRPDRIIAVDNGGGDALAARLNAAAVDGVVSTGSKLSFGRAVALGVAAAVGAPPAAGAPHQAGSPSESDWIWLLSEDSAPEPQALANIIAAVQRSPSVAIAGPKLVDWEHPERIIELGQSLTRTGSRWKLRRQELDQEQYDHLQDTLGVGPVGMLVRQDVWMRLGGFDPALAVYDDGLDLSVRARLAGFRVIVAPHSRIRFAQIGVAGPHIDRRRSVLRTAHRQARTSALHRRLAYAPAALVPFYWIALPFIGVLRMVWALLREQPGNMLGELSAALRVFFRPGAVARARHRIKQDRSVGWDAVRPLRVDPKSVRTARMIDREALRAAQGRTRPELHFVSTGGLGVLLGALVAAAALFWWLLGTDVVSGGGIAPLSDSVAELWRNTQWTAEGPADPYAWVLATLGTLTFWNPSLSIVLLLALSIPLAAFGGWHWAARVTEHPAGRAIGAGAWALSPVLLGSLDAGRLPTVIVVIALPWLLIAASRARESWSWAGSASLLAGVVLACAPALIPAAIVLLIVGACTSPRGLSKVFSIALVPLALFAPLALHAIRTGRPLDLMLDPGLSPAFTPGNPWHLMIGFPEFGLHGWAPLLSMIGLGNAPTTLLVGLLMAPLALLAALGLYTAPVRVSVFGALAAGLGLATAIASAQVQLTSVGAEPLSIWTGSGIALFWIGLATLAASGVSVLRKAAAPLVAVAAIGAVLAVLPVAAHLLLKQSAVQPGSGRLPALVEAAGNLDPEIGTLVLSAVGEHAVHAEIERGSGTRLDTVRTARVQPTLSAEEQRIATVVGQLASTGGEDLRDALAAERIEFVVLLQNDDISDGAAELERGTLQGALDQNAALSSAGETDSGLLWRVEVPAEPVAENVDARAPLIAMPFWWAQIAMLAAMVLLALPTGDIVERPERRPRRPRKGEPGGGAVAPAAPAEGAMPAAPAAPAAPATTAAPAEAAGDSVSADEAQGDPGASATSAPTPVTENRTDSKGADHE
ncbi:MULTISPECIES: glycosyltransferase [unclassified Leucobacter]|uniref:glycosyltransferase n=1 Tax=unclassified Leucobacter TaxID=2621730 RepID=UPI00165DA5EB|nr:MULTISPECIES: glycosyltransferase [unclassified Leucobacter]MBC9936629.1 glycosyltransferase family 2 protein [Leucobacter sp. cx-87]